jgi:hypothetical protein
MTTNPRATWKGTRGTAPATSGLNLKPCPGGVCVGCPGAIDLVAAVPENLSRRKSGEQTTNTGKFSILGGTAGREPILAVNFPEK